MTPEDWLIAIAVALTATLLMYFIGRRLGGPSATVAHAPAPAPAPAAPVPAAPAPVARLDAEDDAEVDPTRVGESAEAAAPKVYRPKIFVIAHDPDVGEPVAGGTH